MSGLALALVFTGPALLSEAADAQAPQSAGQAPQPADKVAVSAAAMDRWMIQQGPGGWTSDVVTLLSTTFRTSATADLQAQFSVECALWTDITETNATSSVAIANVKAWIEIDDQPVPVTNDSNGDGIFNDPDDGKVVLCNRGYKVSTAGMSDAEVRDLFLRTRAGTSFNWAAANVGSGVHTLKVKAQGDVLVEGNGTAVALVGKRTLIVEPMHLPVKTNF